ncbi:hypothetical protein [uncultured Nitrosomonas sp.]|uniref:hypothetical protein n=1 Tax=uncultured Nitrosomonas sp. TaxID=156424 RepID=UPI0025F816E5|nr:hypothetical protein [uncultured Nitrosomonas sp.]
MNKVFKGSQEIKALAEKLQKYDCVSKFDSDKDPEAWRLAHSLIDLEESFKEILDNSLPALREANSEEELHNALLDIGEELRHILYHIKDPKFFSYLFEDS